MMNTGLTIDQCIATLHCWTWYKSSDLNDKSCHPPHKSHKQFTNKHSRKMYSRWMPPTIKLV